MIQVTPTSKNTSSRASEEYIVLHRGFDRLELGFRQRISPKLFERLKARRQVAEEIGEQINFETARHIFRLSPSGVAGGYQFDLSLADEGMRLLFAGPKSQAHYGIQAVLGARGLASRGIEAMLEILREIFVDLGLPAWESAASILRMDICVDIRAPGFHPEPSQFVLHGRSSRDSYANYDNTIAEGARGNITETITIGRMPGRQVTVYNKSLEVWRSGKPDQLSIWNTRLRALGRLPLDFEALKTANVWRIELRAGRRYLKERADIDGLSDLFQELSSFVDTALEQVRLTLPSPTDQNKHRWPNHPVWDLARAELVRCLAGPLGKVSWQGGEGHSLERKKHTLLRQILGCTASLMVMDRITSPDVPDFLSRQSAWLKREFEKDPSKLLAKGNARARKSRKYREI